MNALLIQQSVGKEWWELHIQTIRSTLEYCSLHGINYQPYFCRQQSRIENVMWDRVLLIREALEKRDFVIWMDVDALIVDTSVSLLEAASEFEHVGMIKHYTEGWRDKDWHFNAGIAFFKSTPQTKEFLDHVWECGPIEHPRWKVQATMLLINDVMKIISPINPKWNSTVGASEVPNPVIKSWHGRPDRFEAILKELEV